MSQGSPQMNEKTILELFQCKIKSIWKEKKGL